MTNLLDGKWPAVAKGRGFAAVAHVLRAATIAVIASSCSTMSSEPEPQAADLAMVPANSDDYDTPAIGEVGPALEEQIRKQVSEQFQSLGIQSLLNSYVVTAYIDTQGQEKLVALGEFSSEGPLETAEFQVPPVKGDPPSPTGFKQAVVIFVASPNGARSCGSNSGGSRYCNF